MAADYGIGNVLSIREDFFKDMRGFTSHVCKNKGKDKTGAINYRPVVSVGEDLDNPNIVWVVPLTSNAKKWNERIKITEEKYGRGQCATAYSAFIQWDKGEPPKEDIFLIGNMCPVLKRYLIPYERFEVNLLNPTKQYAMPKKTMKQVRKRAQKAIAIHKSGKPLINVDVDNLYKAQTGKEMVKYENQKNWREQAIQMMPNREYDTEPDFSDSTETGKPSTYTYKEPKNPEDRDSVMDDLLGKMEHHTEFGKDWKNPEETKGVVNHSIDDD